MATASNAEPKTLTEVLRGIKRQFGTDVVRMGAEELTDDGMLSLGSPSLDFVTYGGICEDRIVELSGPEGSGKTTNAFLIAASYQRKEIQVHPDAPRSIVYLDNEGTADPVWAKLMGYDMSAKAKVSTVLIRPEGQSAEQIFDMALDMLKTGEVGLLIFDSIATLVPGKINDASMENQEMGGISKALTRFANTAIGLLRKYHATLIAINQVRENLSGYGDFLITPGGRAWKHACSLRLMFKRGDFFDEDGNTLTKGAESPAGHIIECAVLKTKVCRWDRKLGYCHLNYTKGVDIVADTIDVATHFRMITVPSAGTYVLMNPDKPDEVMKDSSGNGIKIRGKKNVEPYLDAHKDVWKRIYDKCYEMLSKKDDPNIKSFEAMLGLDLNDKFGVDLTHEDGDDAGKKDACNGKN